MFSNNRFDFSDFLSRDPLLQVLEAKETLGEGGRGKEEPRERKREVGRGKEEPRQRKREERKGRERKRGDKGKRMIMIKWYQDEQ